jgi:hypothetical protein
VEAGRRYLGWASIMKVRRKTAPGGLCLWDVEMEKETETAKESSFFLLVHFQSCHFLALR